MIEIAAGSPKKYVPMMRAAGVKVFHKSATVRHALKAQADGVDIVEIVGYEASIAGGQPGDEVGSWVMLAKCLSQVTVPVVASGVTMATRFLATVEAPSGRATTCA